MKINYLSWLHEKTNCHHETVNLPNAISTIDELIGYLQTQDVRYQNLFQHKNTIYVAVNGETKDFSTSITNQDELSFFSPIVGG